MSDATPRFKRIIDQINIRYGLQIPVGTTTAFAIILWILKPSYFQPDSLPYYVVMISFVTLIAIIHSARNERLGKRELAFIYIGYLLSLVLFTGFIAPFLSPFEFLWIALAIGVDLLFGRRQMYMTLAVYAWVLLITLLRTDQVLSIELFFRIVTQFAGVGFISLQVSHYRGISDQEREVLDETSLSTAFERQRLLSLINNMGEAVIATDKKGKILIYNAAVLGLLDTNKSLEGKTLDSMIKLRNAKGKRVRPSSLLDRNPIGLTTTDYLHEFAPNDAINLYINLAPVKLGFKEDSESGYIMLLRDITKEKSLEDERDEFISVVSHELRTPVAIAEGNISNAIFINAEKHNQKVITTSLHQAHEQVLFLANMINDLATLSRAERSTTELEVKLINLNEFISEIERNYKSQANTKKLNLTMSVAKDIKPIATSELYLGEIMQNFVTNAIKYTKKGTILMHARTAKTGEAILSVSDTGIGMTTADQKRVFDKFFRSEDYRTRESAGTGLGLYVTAKLATKISATITLESELNKGTTFTITVPQLELPHEHHKKQSKNPFKQHSDT